MGTTTVSSPEDDAAAAQPVRIGTTTVSTPEAERGPLTTGQKAEAAGRGAVRATVGFGSLSEAAQGLDSPEEVGAAVVGFASGPTMVIPSLLGTAYHLGENASDAANEDLPESVRANAAGEGGSRFAQLALTLAGLRGLASIEAGANRMASSVDDAFSGLDDFKLGEVPQLSGVAKPLAPPKAAFDPAAALKDPASIWGQSAGDIASGLEASGVQATVRQSTKGSGKAQIIEVKGHPEIAQIQVHPGGGLHGGAYYKISTNKGTLKVVDPSTYKPTPGERATIFNRRK